MDKRAKESPFLPHICVKNTEVTRFLDHLRYASCQFLNSLLNTTTSGLILILHFQVFVNFGQKPPAFKPPHGFIFISHTHPNNLVATLRPPNKPTVCIFRFMCCVILIRNKNDRFHVFLMFFYLVLLKTIFLTNLCTGLRTDNDDRIARGW